MTIDEWERAHSKYYLRVDGSKKWNQVSEGEFINAERLAGFIPKPGCGPLATAGFSGNRIEGRIEFAEPETRQ